jgi:DNA topoisomerase I
LLPGMDAETIELDTALRLLSLPRRLGVHAENKEEVVATIGRFGPYVKCGKESRSLPAGVSPLDVTLDQALALLAQPARRARASIEPLRTIGNDPTGRPVQLMRGRFGPYVTDGEVNATLPKSRTPESVTIEEAMELLNRKREAGPSKPRGRKGGRARPDAMTTRTVGTKSKSAKTAAAKKGTAKAAKPAATRTTTAKAAKTTAPKTTTAKPKATEAAKPKKAVAAKPAAAKARKSTTAEGGVDAPAAKKASPVKKAAAAKGAAKKAAAPKSAARPGRVGRSAEVDV